MELKITGPAYEHSSLDVNRQKCVNMFPTQGDLENQAVSALLPTAGLHLLGEIGSVEAIRAVIRFDAFLYIVADDKFYKMTFNEEALSATFSELGTLSTRSGVVSWARNPTQIMLVDGSPYGYIHTVSTDTFQAIADNDFTGGSTVVFMDGYFVYNTPNASTMFTTAVNDGTVVSALDVATAEGSPDKLVGLAVDKRELWAFGEKSVEIWYNSANPTGFPFTRREGAFIDQGCGAKHSILNFDNTLMWLDDRGYIVRANGYQPQVVSSEAISQEIRSYSKIDDAVAYKHTDRGHLFYVITFPTANKTWAYDATTGAWHERAFFGQNDSFERDLVSSHVNYNQFDIVGSRSSGKVFLLGEKYYTHGDDPIHRVRVTQHERMELQQIGIPSLELHMEAGKGNITGAGSDPQVMMRYSNDGGYTWSHELWRSSGKIGEYAKRIRWNRLGTAREWLFEFRIVEPIEFALISAYIEISTGAKA